MMAFPDFSSSYDRVVPTSSVSKGNKIFTLTSIPGHDPPGGVLARASGLIPRVHSRLALRPQAGRSDCLLAVLFS